MSDLLYNYYLEYVLINSTLLVLRVGCWVVIGNWSDLSLIQS